MRQRARCHNSGVKGNNTYQIIYTGKSDVAMDGAGVVQPQFMYHFLIEFLELVVSWSGLGEGVCDCTVLTIHLWPFGLVSPSQTTLHLKFLAWVSSNLPLYAFSHSEPG